ncbi:atypical/Alpha protein kinase [Coprinopsis cinerea AmutBmut pab1-1]|nr:atypical/Alpha protein kinase [Coprinopsis cinerea AmutBmut pab1-1]
MLELFYERCEEKGVDAYLYLSFAKGLLLQEIGKHSPASGQLCDSETDHDGQEVIGIKWLAEERHLSRRIVRFCGTMQHQTTRTDLAYQTVHTFNHFVYLHTNRQLIFADLQGTPTSVKLASGEVVEGMMLFDPMTHTINHGSGIGDFGQEGIDTFVEQHTCGPLCRALHLLDSDGSDVNAPKATDTEESEDEAQDND